MTDTSANNLPNEQEANLNKEVTPEVETETTSVPEAVAPEANETTPEVTPEATPETSATEEPKAVEAEVQEPAEAKVAKTEVEEVKEAKVETIDYTTFPKEDLVSALKKIIAEGNVQNIKDEVEIIRSSFYRLHNAEVAELKEKFIADGGLPEDFQPAPQEIEEKLKEQYSLYKERRGEHFAKLETERKANYEAKIEVINAIENLINSQEAFNTTFHEFHELQEKWKGIGAVPQTEVKGLWEKYHHTVEKFYAYIKINKELRDLDLKKNLEAKTLLCARAEELIIAPSVVNAFKELQELHHQWRDVGPVPLDKKEEIWERFKVATTQINKAHQEYYEKLKEEQENNLKAKTVLCEKIEEINGLGLKSFKEWEERATEVIEIQKIWKLIGFTPKKYNNDIYNRFRMGCDTFFSQKRDFYNAAKEEQKTNLAAKLALVEQAEAMKESTDWKKTTELYVSIQKRWKEIGSVPRKHSDQIWERFRAACNVFFDLKKKHFSSIDDEQTQNLEKKQALIEKVKAFATTGNNDEDLQLLKDIQNEWMEIGFVPFSSKDKVQKEFREIINKQFDQLRAGASQRNEEDFKSRLDDLKHSPKGQNKLRFERDKLSRKMQKVEKDIVTWENNIGFFSNSKNANALVKDIERKIEKAKELVIELRDKLALIDSSDND